MWPEVQKAKDESRRELVFNGKPAATRIKEEGKLDEAIFDLESLNFLQISETSLEEISPKIGQLGAMINLVLHSNKLSALPPTISQLSKLSMLNVSCNALESLPDELFTISSLMLLDVSQNMLSSLQNISGLTNLHEFRADGNKLTLLPEGITTLEKLLNISASHNLLTELPEDLNALPLLKELHVADNQLTVIPLSISQCGKLRILDVRENKIKDRKMAQVANKDTNLAKPMITFLKPLYDKQLKAQGGKSKRRKASEAEAGEEDVEDITDKLEILHCASDKASGLKLQLSASVLEVRPHILCCVLRNLDFTKSSHLFKHFISLQTRLHEGVCAKRLAATIATHDLKSVKSPLTYEAKPSAQTMLIPLGRQKEIAASDFIKKLKKEAEEQRKQKKRNTVSGIHKYLDLLGKHTEYPFLVDNEGKVISFPPITNCEATKICEETTDILVEVTSATSLSICKEVMELLLQETLLLGIGSMIGSSGDGAKKYLVVEQVKITDLEGQMKSVYPSRVDLIETPYLVIRE